MLGTIIGAIILGTILGVLARIILPGDQKIPWWLTIGVGIVAALLGGFIYEWAGGTNTPGIDWIRFLVQLGVALVATFLVAGFWAKRGGKVST